MTITSCTLTDIKSMSVREFCIVRQGCSYWRSELKHVLVGGCGLG